MRIWAALLIACCTCWISCGSKQAVKRGGELFASDCIACHSLNGDHLRAPDLHYSGLLSHDVNGSLIGPVIRSGRLALGMPAFPNFTPTQITDLAAFLHSISRVRKDDAGTSRTVSGDAEQGKAYFAKTCSGCHSPTGDLAGVASRLSPKDLKYRIVDPSQGVTHTATVRLPDGRRFEGTVVHDDEFTISIIAVDGWYHSWPRSLAMVEIHDPLAAHHALVEKYTTRDFYNVFAYLLTLK
jgi:cytochrome c oxidase cbb3-type subunit 3